MPILNCLICGNQFTVTPNRLETAKYCSYSCRNTSYKGKSFSPETEFKNGQKFSKERNKKISLAHKGKPKPWLRKPPKIYIKVCKWCGKEFEACRISRTICDNEICQKNKAKLRKIDPIIEKARREKISKTLKGRIPKNLKQNIKSNNSYRQYDMYKIIIKYFPDALYSYYVKTEKSFRILDTGLPKLKLDFEYNGKVHLMRSVKKKDKQRKKDLNKMGWRIIIINRKNFKFMDRICDCLKRQYT